MATTIEKQLSHRNRRSGVLVPLLEDLLTKPLEIENNLDAAFIYDLTLKQIEREKRRSLKESYSPSSLATCLRQVHLVRYWEELGIIFRRPIKIEPNFYFLTGDWLHMKWQFALYKLNQRLPNSRFQLYGVEIPVQSKHGDHAGTIDALFTVNEVPYVGDFKGVNVRTFGSAEVGDVDMKYRIQLADYQMLANVDKSVKFPKVEKGLLIFENKGGPTPRRPIALCEVEVPMKDHLPEIKFRIGELRKHEEEGSIPDPECISTKSIQFTECPFRDFCEKEIKRNESRNAKRHSVAVPAKRRTDRSRRDKH
jgi:hypothetical protein